MTTGIITAYGRSRKAASRLATAATTLTMLALMAALCSCHSDDLLDSAMQWKDPDLNTYSIHHSYEGGTDTIFSQKNKWLTLVLLNYTEDRMYLDYKPFNLQNDEPAVHTWFEVHKEQIDGHDHIIVHTEPNATPFIRALTLTVSNGFGYWGIYVHQDAAPENVE